jgi:hypothetical protein
MHAGNKYFTSGEFSTNDVAVYIHNVTVGFGAVQFNGTIFEYNKIAIYNYNTTTPFSGLSIRGGWFEGNGTHLGGTTAVDSWSGTTLSTTTLTNKTTIVDGDKNHMNYYGSILSDISVIATNTVVSGANCRHENIIGNGGGLNSVVISSSISFDKSYCNNGFGSGNGDIKFRNIDYLPVLTFSSSSIDSGSASFNSDKRLLSKIVAPANTLLTNTFSRATPYSGSGSGSGVVYSNGTHTSKFYNRFTFSTITPSNYYSPDDTTIAIPADSKHYVVSVDARITAGSASLQFWDRSTKQFFTGHTLDSSYSSEWTTVYSVRKNNGVLNSVFLDIRGNDDVATVDLSAMQVSVFDTNSEALAFVNSKTFIYPDVEKLTAYTAVATTALVDVYDLTTLEVGRYSYECYLTSSTADALYFQRGVLVVHYSSSSKYTIIIEENGANSAVAINSSVLQYSQSSGAGKDITTFFKEIK